MVEVAPIFVSLAYCVYVFAICELLRQIGTKYCTWDYETPYLFIEFAGTLQVCSMLFENKQIFVYYGAGAYTVSLFLVVFLHCLTIRTAYGHPVPLFEMWRVWLIPTNAMVANIALQFFAAFASFGVGWVFWNFRMRPDHTAFANYFVCYSPVQIHPALVVLAELVASLLLRLIILKSVEIFTRTYAIFVATTYAVFVRVGLLMHVSLYMNPILASSQVIGCYGLPFWKGTLVYWTGSITGSLIAGHLYWKYLYRPKPAIPSGSTPAVSQAEARKHRLSSDSMI